MHDRTPENAPPDARDVLIQAEVVEEALARLGYNTARLTLTLDLKAGRRQLRRIKPALVFNLVECLEGQGRLIHWAPSLLDSLGIPYTGSPTEAIFITSDKIEAKRRMVAAGIPTPPWKQLGNSEERAGAALARRGQAIIVKPIWEHASIGLDDRSILRDRSQRRTAEALAARANGCGEYFAEVFIEGREMNVALLAGEDRPQVLPPSEILFVDYPEGKPRIVGYEAKWVEGSFSYTHTPRTFDFAKDDEALLQKIRDLALRCWHLFGLRGYARVDFRVDRRGRPWVLEVNANPCLSPDAGFAAAVARAGLTFDQAIARIVDDALRCHKERMLPRRPATRGKAKTNK